MRQRCFHQSGTPFYALGINQSFLLGCRFSFRITQITFSLNQSFIVDQIVTKCRLFHISLGPLLQQMIHIFVRNSFGLFCLMILLFQFLCLDLCVIISYELVTLGKLINQNDSNITTHSVVH